MFSHAAMNQAQPRRRQNRKEGVIYIPGAKEYIRPQEQTYGRAGGKSQSVGSAYEVVDDRVNEI